MRLIAYCRKSSEAEDRQVLSIESQRSELLKVAAADPTLTIVSFIEESKSAKAPGRPLFDAMIASIERGEADGIIAWHPDRLARNSMDGGRIIYLLDQGRLKTLRFATFTFENNPQGKFMLSITFGYSKYYVDTLSENVKRGNRTKVEKGILPHQPPIGYLNDRVAKTIVSDPDRYPLVKEMWRLLLEERRRPEDIARIARTEWGLTTSKHSRLGGALISRSNVYRVFRNPFFAGMINWHGQLYPGRHQAMISFQQFEAAQYIINPCRDGQRQRYEFAFTGFIRCGACGRPITAEHKVNRFGSRYVYYHCTRTGRPRCREPFVEVNKLEVQIISFLDGLTIAPTTYDAYISAIKDRHDDPAELNAIKMHAAAKAVAETERQIEALLDLRLRDLIGDEEMARKRQALDRRRVGLLEALKDDRERESFEPLADALTLMSKAVVLFSQSDDAIKRMILETVGSNPTLSGRKLSIEAAIPFRRKDHRHVDPSLRAWWDEIRTLQQLSTSDEKIAKRLNNIHILAELSRQLPEAPQAEAA